MYIMNKIEAEITIELIRTYFFILLFPPRSLYKGGIIGCKLNIANIPVQSKNIEKMFDFKGILGYGN